MPTPNCLLCAMRFTLYRQENFTVLGFSGSSAISLVESVISTDSTSEIADDPEKPNTVKFAWRYTENRIAQRNPLGVGIFTEPYDYTFR